jgi:hypothetical protein
MRRHEEIPEARGLRLLLHLLDHRNHLPALALMRLLVVIGLSRADILVDEIPDPIPEIRLSFAQRKIHAGSPFVIAFVAG